MIGRNKVRTIHDAATLQYANGKSVARRTIGSGRFSPYIGFHIEAGRDAALDEALRDAGISQCEIKHQRPGGAEVIKHWDFGESIELYPITSGPVATTVAGSLAGGNARETASSGIGLRWANGERSKLAVRGFLRPLVKVGYLRLVQFSVRSRMTDELLKALLDHGRVCELADHLIDRTTHAEPVTFHEIALPLGPGEETEWGKGDTATVIPVVSYHPPAVDQAYILERWRPETVHEAALREWEGIQLWAREYALQSDERNPQGDEAAIATVGG
ncbi:hypothetical protein [Candidatus Chloroploca sp. Khr17]|uniref:hypothetical protein n=1 Tax=Candidatus Chloroploca sp. Khr17 TaxID=2496869 RepID=UPI00101D13B9|nr:hypothetical protein [Candidatus Chloroploca sp. Khr17]